MPQIIITEDALAGMERCRRFLAEKNPAASRKAAQTIAETLKHLEQNPELGRPFDKTGDLRELLIPFGAAGYVSLSLR